MKLPHRRQFLHLAAGTVVLPAVSRIARAQAYPTRPVRWVVGTAAGGAQDIVARIMAQWLSERLAQQFVIENRPGANGTIATDAVVHALPDGYTLLHFGAAIVISASLYEKLNFNLVRDIAPVASIMSFPNILVVNQSVPAKTVPEFVAYAKANPGKLNMGSGGNGSIQHTAGELFQMMAGVNLVHVPYRGGAPAVTDLIGGQVQVIFSPAPECLEYVRAGRLRPLAVTSAARLDALPEVPTVGEFVPGYEASGWMGVGAPKNIPVDIIDSLNKAINAGLAEPQIQSRLASMSAIPFPLSPDVFKTFVATEVERWAKVVKFAGIKAE
jgi:tripartite-type tricarboxylate transporter receptor subunit TctC